MIKMQGVTLRLRCRSYRARLTLHREMKKENRKIRSMSKQPAGAERFKFVGGGKEGGRK